MAFAAGMSVFPGGAVDPADGPAGEPATVRRAAAREVAEETGVRLGVESLAPWARWITPAGEPRRFDTWFFLAALPGGQSATAHPGEAVDGTWLTPRAALLEAGAGLRDLLPPTALTLQELAAYDVVSAAMAAGPSRDLAPIQPEIVGGNAVLPDGRVVPLP
ncbi:MAG: NUDIX hydrolase [Mycobacteriales bacterium]